MQGCQLGYTGLPDSSFFMNFWLIFSISTNLTQINANLATNIWFSLSITFHSKTWHGFQATGLPSYVCRVARFCILPLFCAYILPWSPILNPAGGQKRVKNKIFHFFLTYNSFSLPKNSSEKKISWLGQNVPYDFDRLFSKFRLKNGFLVTFDLFLQILLKITR